MTAANATYKPDLRIAVQAESVLLQPVLEQLPPYDEASEQALLACILSDTGNPPLIAELSERIKPEDFFLLRHAHIYDAICTLYLRKIGVTTVTVTSELVARQALDDVGGSVYINKLYGMSFGFLSLGRDATIYADVIKRLSLRRELIRVAEQLAQDAVNPAVDLASLARFAERVADRVMGINPVTTTDDMGSIASQLYDVTEKAADDHEAGRAIDVCNTRLEELDMLLLGGGFWPGDLITVYAPSSHGKSTVCAHFAKEAAKDGKRVLYFALEMKRLHMAARVIASETQIPYDKLVTGVNKRGEVMTADEWNRYTAAIAAMQEWPLTFDDAPALPFAEIARRTRREHKYRPLRMIVVDFAQLTVMANTKAADRVGELDALAYGLKALALELGITVVLAAQANREGSHRTETRPRISDIRGSAAFEMASDVVIGVWNESRDNPTAPANKLHMFVQKNRLGGLGDIAVHFDGACNRLSKLATHTFSVASTATEPF